MTPRRGALVIAVVLATACHKSPPEDTQTEARVPVQVAKPRRGTITAWLRATGTVEPAPGADFLVTAPQPARVAALPFATGDSVRRGSVIVRFDAPTLRADLAARGGEVGQSHARLENARQNYARLDALLGKGIASRKQVEDAKREQQEAQAGVIAADGTHAAAADLASRATVAAPFDGVIVQRWHNPGDLVDVNEHVVRIVDTRHLEVNAAVPVGDLARIAVGRSAQVSVAGGDPEPATVAGMPGAVDTATGTALVRLRLSKPQPVGSPVQVEIAAETADAALVVPASAVVRNEDKTVVFVVGADGKAHRKEVELGLLAKDEVQIQTGIDATDDVVVKGNDELPDGATVVLEKAPAP